MTCNTHRAYKMVDSYRDKNRHCEDIVVELPYPKKKLLGAGQKAHCEAIAARVEGGKVEEITGSMLPSEWI